MKHIVISFLLFFPLMHIMSQTRNHTSNFNGWMMYFGDHKIDEKWSIHLELQVRNNAFVRMQQLLLRPAINFHPTPNLIVTAGYCFVETYPYGAFAVKKAFPEHRLYEQLQLKNQISILEFANRLRVEQRFSKLPVSATELGDYTYTNRVRILNRVSIPFKGKEINDNSFYISFYDEIFIGFGKKVGLNIFDQNRAYIALGYKIPKVGRLEIGYMEQTLIKSDGLKVEDNHTLQFGLASNIDFYKKKKQK